jgi:hypothetical protein
MCIHKLDGAGRRELRRARFGPTAEVSRDARRNGVWLAESKSDVCYFLAIGANTDPWRFTAAIEELLQLDVDLSTPPRLFPLVFPRTDLVRVVTRRGCSCDLFEPAGAAPAGRKPSNDAVWLIPAWRRALASAFREIGAFRLCARTHRDALTGRVPRTTMALHDLATKGVGLPANVLIDVVVDRGFDNSICGATE